MHFMIRTMSSRLRFLAVIGLVALAALGSLDIHQHYRTSVPAIVFGIAQVVPVLVERRQSRFALGLSAVVGTSAALLLDPVSNSEPWPWPVTSLVAFGLVLGQIAAREQLPTPRIGYLCGIWVLAQLPGAVALLLQSERGSLTGLVPVAVVSALALNVGHLVHSRHALRHEVEEQSERSTQLEERARIARELHDVVAHHLSIVVVRADSAAARLRTVDPAVRAELAAIADEARASLDEMRRALRLLRGTDGSVAGTDPVPGVGDIDSLIRAATDAGATVHADLPANSDFDLTTQSTAYRVVQEALSNALRHAPGAPVQVAVRNEPDTLEVIVQNRVRGLRPASDGHGLTGMRERVSAVGGTVDAAPTPDGNYVVHARLPRREHG